MRWLPVWQRNLLVWRKLAGTSVIGNLADPLIYMLGLGYGLGKLIPEMGGMSYLAFVASGTVCYSTMNSATFEAMYSGFSRMHVQKTWDAMLNAPLSLDDIVLAETMWAASKSLLSGICILFIASLFGLTQGWLWLWILPIVFLIGLCFASLGMIMTAIAPSYDFFMYWFTLAITPMMLISGVWFPADQLPAIVQTLAACLPLSHAVQLVRPLMTGQLPVQTLLHVSVLLGYIVVAYLIAHTLLQRRLLK